jgi:type I restriction enzyme S subunit
LYVTDFHGNDQRFAYYLLRHFDFRSYNSGSAQPSLNRNFIHPICIDVPPVSEQRAIAHVLGTLDDKIALNRRMNETLEAMARALFKSWFVDFDPVRAKMEGRDTGLPQDIAGLFPDRMVDSELGQIPEGWEVGTLGDVSVLRRHRPDPAGVPGDTPYIGLANMPRRSIALADWGEAITAVSRKSAFKAGDILFGKLRPYFHKVGIAPVDGLCSTDILVLGARQPMWSSFVLACVSSSVFVAHTSQTATGTKMPRTSWKAMKRYELCRPTVDVAAEFHRHVTPILRRIVGNIHESRTLAALRDTLLPPFISGTLRCPLPTFCSGDNR